MSPRGKLTLISGKLSDVSRNIGRESGDDVRLVWWTIRSENESRSE